jgi:hypothetical protein
MATPPSASSFFQLETDDAAIPNEFKCPLTLEIMENPVMTRLGHSFERNELFLWLQKNRVCPLTRNPLKLSDIITNKALKGKIQEWKKQNGQTILEDTNESDDVKGVLDSLWFCTFSKSDKHVIKALKQVKDPNALNLLDRLTKQRRRAKREEKLRRAAAA